MSKKFCNLFVGAFVLMGLTIAALAHDGKYPEKKAAGAEEANLTSIEGEKTTSGTSENRRCETSDD